MGRNRHTTPPTRGRLADETSLPHRLRPRRLNTACQTPHQQFPTISTNAKKKIAFEYSLCSKNASSGSCDKSIFPTKLAGSHGCTYANQKDYPDLRKNKLHGAKPKEAKATPTLMP